MSAFVNTSGLKPLGRAVLIAPYKPSVTSSVIHIPEDAMNREQMIEQRAIVVEVGPACWVDEIEPRAKPGDRVIVARYSGYQAQGTADDKMYRFVNDKDIFAAITEEKQP